MTEISRFHHFPDEVWDDDILPDDLPDGSIERDHLAPYGYNSFMKQLIRASREAVGADEGYLPKEVESELAELIQAGMVFEVKATGMAGEYDGRYDVEIERGRAAKERLVMANAPFAAYLARCSMNIGPVRGSRRSRTRTPVVSGGRIAKETRPGTMTPIAQMASPRASLEDRTQVALEAMWKAADKYKANSKARFINFASWSMQNALERYIPTEDRGWHVADDLVQKYLTAMKESELYGSELRIPSHRVDGEGMHAGYHPEIVFAGRAGVSLEDVPTMLTKDEDDVFGEAGELPLSDYAADPNISNDAALSLEDQQMTEQLAAVLDTLSEREAGVIEGRFGLERRALVTGNLKLDEGPLTLDDVGKVYGVTRERVRQIESKAMSKLRHGSRSSVLVPYVEDLSPGFTIARMALPLVSGAVNVTTERILAHPQDSLPAVEDESLPLPPDDGRESWQTSPDEEWDEPVRRLA